MQPPLTPPWANITINGGYSGFQTTTISMGDPTKTVTINSGGILRFLRLANVMDKEAV